VPPLSPKIKIFGGPIGKKRAKLQQFSEMSKYFCIFLQFFLRMSKKSSNFAGFFEKKA